VSPEVGQVENIEAHLILLPLATSNRTAVLLGIAGLTWSTIRIPALILEIRFRFGLFIDETTPAILSTILTLVRTANLVIFVEQA
jgi:hypothetical protein